MDLQLMFEAMMAKLEGNKQDIINKLEDLKQDINRKLEENKNEMNNKFEETIRRIQMTELKKQEGINGQRLLNFPKELKQQLLNDFLRCLCNRWGCYHDLGVYLPCQCAIFLSIAAQVDLPNSSTISKYFQSTQQNKSEEIVTANDFESSKNSSLPATPEKDIKLKQTNNSFSDENDFRTPIAINKVSKLVKLKPPPLLGGVAKTKPTRKLKPKRSKTSKLQQDIRSFTDTNPDHMQMALALSESTYEAENQFPGSLEHQKDSNEKLEAFKQALEKFGFQYNYKKIESTRKRGDIKKLDKKSRYRHITPILYIRSNEEREALVSAKINEILSQTLIDATPKTDCLKIKLFSEKLQAVHVQTKLWALNSLTIEELNYKKLYINNLNLSPSEAKCGHLLKDWRNIAGRENTPLREIDQNRSNNSMRSISPDLFDSDEDICLQNSNKRKNNSKEFNTPKRFSSDDFPKQFNLDCNVKKSESIDDVVILSDDEQNINEPIEFLVEALNNECNNEAKAEEEQENLESGELYFDLTQSSGDSKDNLIDKRIDEEHSTNFPENIRIAEPKLNLAFTRSLNQNNEEDTIVLSEHERLSWESALAQPISEDNFRVVSESSQLVIGNNIEDEINLEERNILYYSTEQMQQLEISKCDLNEITLRIDSPQPKIVPKNGETNSEFPSIIDESKTDETHCTKDLNVTSYINFILNEDVENEEKIDNSMDNIEERNFSSSHESIIISDDEINYSSICSTPVNAKANYKKNIYHLSDVEEDMNLQHLEPSTSFTNNFNKYPEHRQLTRLKEQTPLRQSIEPIILDDSADDDEEDHQINNIITHNSPQPTNHEISNIAGTAPGTINDSLDLSLNTTPNSKFVIKKNNITPMLDFEAMDTPTVVEELNKFGIKPLKRKKGARFLKYIYEATHPLQNLEAYEDSHSDNETNNSEKKRRKISYSAQEVSLKEIPLVGDIVTERELDNNELIFEKIQSKKIASCQIPLQIVWYNFICNNPDIRQNILLYEPLQLEVLHNLLKEQGFKFNIQDLLTFLDRKCVTIRTNQGNTGKRKRY